MSCRGSARTHLTAAQSASGRGPESPRSDYTDDEEISRITEGSSDNDLLQPHMSLDLPQALSEQLTLSNRNVFDDADLRSVPPVPVLAGLPSEAEGTLEGLLGSGMLSPGKIRPRRSNMPARPQAERPELQVGSIRNRRNSRNVSLSRHWEGAHGE